MNKKWSYRVEFKAWNPMNQLKTDYADWLNRLGDEGYDLVSVIKLETALPDSSSGTLIQYTFKREEVENFQSEQVHEDLDAAHIVYADLPEGYDYHLHQKYFSREFDRLFGEKWLVWRGNSNAKGVGLSESDFENIRAERAKLKVWYMNMRPNYSKAGQAFDSYWQYLKFLSSYHRVG